MHDASANDIANDIVQQRLVNRIIRFIHLFLDPSEKCPFTLDLFTINSKKFYCESKRSKE